MASNRDRASNYLQLFRLGLNLTRAPSCQVSHFLSTWPMGKIGKQELGKMAVVGNNKLDAGNDNQELGSKTIVAGGKKVAGGDSKIVGTGKRAQAAIRGPRMLWHSVIMSSCSKGCCNVWCSTSMASASSTGMVLRQSARRQGQ